MSSIFCATVPCRPAMRRPGAANSSSLPRSASRLKKRSGRPVIHEVVADIDDEASEIVLLTHWMGGVHTELRLPRRRRGQRNSISADMLDAVRQLVLIANDDLIAGILTRNS